MGSAFEALAPLLAAFPTAESPLTPDDAAGIARLTSAIERVAASDLEGAMVGPDPSFRTDFHGAAGLIERWTDWLSPYQSFRMEIEELIESDDVLVTSVRQLGTMTAGGPEVEAESAAVWWVRDGRLARVEFHLDREAALRSAGLGS